MILETNRTTIRPFKKQDLEDYHEYCSQVGVGDMAGWKPHTTLTESKKRLTINVKNPNIFAIEFMENKKVIGYIAINDDTENDREDTKELGFALHRDYQNLGIMSEVVLRILNHMFQQNIDYVYACCFVENAASKWLIEKCGFAFEREGTYFSDAKEETLKTFEYMYSSEAWYRKSQSKGKETRRLEKPNKD